MNWIEFQSEACMDVEALYLGSKGEHSYPVD